jgi:hypothetical protein
MYRAMHVLDCVARTPQEYVEIAVRLGTDPDYRAAASKKILAAHEVLFEDHAAAPLRRNDRAWVCGRDG